MERIKRFVLILRLLGFAGHMAFSFTTGIVRRKFAVKCLSPPPIAPSPTGESPSPKNIVIVGASFAGYHAARMLHGSLPAGYRLVVIEPHSHFHFTWVFPRFCVIEGHEKKAFIPYALRPLGESGKEEESFRWIRGRATELTKDLVTVRFVGEGQEHKTETLRYEYLLLATGSVSKETSVPNTAGLPSRIVDDGREDGARRMRDMQARIKDSKRMVVVGGGAAGVELAADAASKYNINENPEKKIVLVHSRSMPMHRFGPRLQNAALEGLKKQGVEIFLEDRVMGDIEDGMVTLKSGRKLECDFLVDCTGQKPASSLLASLAPNCITPSGHVKIRDTLQLDSDEFSHIYSCGDVADTGVERPNGRSATVQAWVAADNILSCVFGKGPTVHYSRQWVDEHIKLTLGLDTSVMHLSDGSTELLFNGKEKPTLMAHNAWMKMGIRPFKDPEDAEEEPPHSVSGMV